MMAYALLDGAYATFTTQLIATVLVLILAKRTSGLDRFFITFVCASAIAEIANVLLPTLGPMSVLGGNANFVNVPTLGRTTADIVLALREGRLASIDLGAIDGIISFPSLHAAVAVMVPFTLRWNRPLFWPIVVLDGMMLVSAVPGGNHYLADVVGGVAVAAVAILCPAYPCRARSAIHRGRLALPQRANPRLMEFSGMTGSLLGLGWRISPPIVRKNSPHWYLLPKRRPTAPHPRRRESRNHRKYAVCTLGRVL